MTRLTDDDEDGADRVKVKVFFSFFFHARTLVKPTSPKRKKKKRGDALDESERCACLSLSLCVCVCALSEATSSEKYLKSTRPHCAGALSALLMLAAMRSVASALDVGVWQSGKVKAGHFQEREKSTKWEIDDVNANVQSTSTSINTYESINKEG